MIFKLKENYYNNHLSRRQIDNFRVKISRLCGIPGVYIHIYENGRFTIDDLDESTANRILMNIRAISYNASIHKGQYDFSHYYGIGLPKQKCSIEGYLIVEDDNNDQ